MYSWQVTLKLSQLILKMHFLKGTYLIQLSPDEYQSYQGKITLRTYQGLHNMCPQKVYDFLDQDKVYPVE